MEQYFQKIEDLLSKGDPTVRSWFLVQTNYMPIVLSGLYVLISTYVGPAFMRNRKPFELRISMIVLNFFLVVAYAICVTLFLWNLPYNDFGFFCKGNVVKKGHFTYTIAEVCWVIYILKYIEFLDTIFFFLRKKEKQISFLHVFHHAALPVLAWMILRSETAGFQLIPAVVNSFIHIVMYSYYGLAAMGPSVRKYLWWKKYITQLQIIQFILIIFIMAVIIPVTGCNVGILQILLDVVFAGLFLYLFCKFYMENYESKKKAKRAAMNRKIVEIEEKNLNSLSNGKAD